MTKQRMLIYNIVKDSVEHMTADQIYAKAKEIMPAIAMGTVYRNLNLMVQDGQLRKVSVYNGPDRFDRVCQDHDHLVCTGCGCVSDAPATNVLAMFKDSIGQDVLGYDLNLYYQCEKCRQQANQ